MVQTMLHVRAPCMQRVEGIPETGTTGAQHVTVQTRVLGLNALWPACLVRSAWWASVWQHCNRTLFVPVRPFSPS